MRTLTRDELLPLETYALCRDQFRRDAMAHKADRQIALGEHVRLLFEDRTTIQYQIQEMLRVERIFESEAIQEELDTYNPLIPDGNNWKATMMIEYTDVEERRRALARLIAIEDRTWVEVDGCERVYAVADEDLERENGEKTSSVHFLTFPLSGAMVAAARAGKGITMGVDHENYWVSYALPERNRRALVADLEE